jgi:putative peptide zinc metalloprotease protein
VPEQKNSTDEKLARWHGTIFSERNNHAWLDRGTPLLSIAPSEEMQAVLLIDQDHRNDVRIGQPVTMQCRHLPGHYLRGTIHEIGERQTDEAPASLTQKAGGNVATVTDKTGRETLLSSAYRGIVPLKYADELPMNIMGTRGEARVIISKRSLVGWGWRIVRQTFNFRL